MCINGQENLPVRFLGCRNAVTEKRKCGCIVLIRTVYGLLTKNINRKYIFLWNLVNMSLFVGTKCSKTKWWAAKIHYNMKLRKLHRLRLLKNTKVQLWEEQQIGRRRSRGWVMMTHDNLQHGKKVKWQEEKGNHNRRPKPRRSPPPHWVLWFILKEAPVLITARSSSCVHVTALWTHAGPKDQGIHPSMWLIWQNLFIKA